MRHTWPEYFAQQRLVRHLAIRAGIPTAHARALAAKAISRPPIADRASALLALAAARKNEHTPRRFSPAIAARLLLLAHTRARQKLRVGHHH
jgi:hypothetical protein